VSVRNGDVAVLIGSQGEESITAAQVAEWAGTIPWEILTSISYRVHRAYLGINAS
ncbi:MAG: alanine racemase, partial [Verrucomicrobia bacterium]|nr:alanine racemase [Verrucomicrobiota bacterium]